MVNACGVSGLELLLRQQSIHTLLHDARRSRGKSLQRGREFDVVHCAGLFDYLSDRVCARLNHRDEMQMAALAKGLPTPTIITEASGANVLSSIRRT